MTSLQLPITREHALKCELSGEVLRKFGRLRLQVTGWSMLPTVWPGDTLLIDGKTAGDVSEGDIVLFMRERRLFAHRMIGRTIHGQILTRGDAMTCVDAPVRNDHLLGRVAYIVRNGKCIEPDKSLRLSHRAVGALVRTSETATRVIVGIHGMPSKFRKTN